MVAGSGSCKLCNYFHKAKHIPLFQCYCFTLFMPGTAHFIVFFSGSVVIPTKNNNKVAERKKKKAQNAMQ